MDINQVKELLDAALKLQEIKVNGKAGHYEISVIDDIFSNMSLLQKHRLVYAPLMPYIQSKEIHAVSIKAYTPVEWERTKKLMML